MKRNKEWAAILLGFLEDVPDGSGLARHELMALFGQSDSVQLVSSEEVWDALDYHLRLLCSAGFVLMEQSDKGMAHDDFDLTWAGHDYLDTQG